ncbi:MAG: DUF58 domain-containing protein [Alphaproteobacteria bacterium]
MRDLKSTDLPEKDLRSYAEESSASLPSLRMEAENAVTSVLHGEHAQSKPGAGEKFWQYREYVPGDRPQDIDWRQTAKTEHVFIKQKEWQTPQSIIFWCNQNASMAFQSVSAIASKSHDARVLTLALALLMVRAGEKVGLFASRKIGRSENTLLDMEVKLTQDIRSTAPLADFTLADLPKNASFVQIGDFLEPLEKIEDNFKQFTGRASGGLIVQVLDPAELDLHYNGRVLFQGTGEKQQIDNVASIRAQYKERINAHNKALEQLCREYGWHYYLHRTDRAIKETLTHIRTLLSYENLGPLAERIQ